MSSTQPKKRQRTVKDDEDAKRSRGRPRVEGEDETASDRRRTQIRLAQRAYRQRKENTISTLNDQVSALQSTVENMSKSFMAFNDRLLTAGVLQGRTDLTEHLRNVTELFLSLAKNVQQGSSTDSAESDTDHTAILSAETARLPPQSSRSTGNSNIVDIGLGFVQIMDDPATHDLPTPPEDYVDVTFPSLNNSQAQAPSRFDMFNMTGNDFTLFPTSTSADANTLTITTTSNQIQQQQQQNAAMNKQTSIFTPMSLPAPYTFSINEITFARRLQRAGFERAYHLVSRAEQNPEAFRRVFKLSLPYATREQFTAKLKKLLTSDTTAPLDVPCLPSLQLGGAGSHYQINRDTNKYVVRYGPHRQVNAQQSGYDSNSPLDFDFDWTFYEGEWFDSNDVEGYFTELGMTLNPKATFVENTVPDRGALMQLLRKNGVVPARSPSPSASWNSNMSTTEGEPMQQQINPQTGRLTDPTDRLFQELGMGTVPGMEDINFSEDNATAWLMGSGYKTPDFLSSGWNGFQEPSNWDVSDSLNNSLRSLSHSPDELANALRKVTIDLGSLVDSLVSRAVCLGRGPGFRRKDMEQALVGSVIEVA